MREDFTVFDLLKRAKELSPGVEISYGDSKQTYRQTYERVLGLSRKGQQMVDFGEGGVCGRDAAHEHGQDKQSSVKGEHLGQTV